MRKHRRCRQEVRLAKDTPTLFLEMRAVDQADWAGDLVDRVESPGALAPAVCILDSGANRAHPLIEPALRGPRTSMPTRMLGVSGIALLLEWAWHRHGRGRTLW